MANCQRSECQWANILGNLSFYKWSIVSTRIRKRFCIFTMCNSLPMSFIMLSNLCRCCSCSLEISVSRSVSACYASMAVSNLEAGCNGIKMTKCHLSPNLVKSFTSSFLVIFLPVCHFVNCFLAHCCSIKNAVKIDKISI